MKPKAYNLYDIPGLEYTDDGNSSHDNWGAYKWRDKWDDMKATKAFYDEYPPEVGDLVVVLHTASGYQMLRPDVKPIIAITKQKRLVVDHIHELYAGKSFWRTGQNCKAPRGQCWLVPAELYKDIPFSKPTAPPTEPELSMRTHELVNAMGGRDAFKERATKLIKEYGLSSDEALLQMEKEHENLVFFHKRNHRNLGGKPFVLEDIQRHHDHFLGQGKELCKKNREVEQEMLDKGQLRGLSRHQNYIGRKYDDSNAS